MGIIQKSVDAANRVVQREVLLDFTAMRDGWQPSSLSEARALAKRLRLFLPSAAKRAGFSVDPEQLDEVCRLLEDGDYLLYGYQYADMIEAAVALPEGA